VNGRESCASPAGSGGRYPADVSQFEQLSIPIVLGLLCRAHNKIAVLLKSLYLYRNNPIVYTVPKINIISLSTLSVLWLVWYSTYTEYVNMFDDFQLLIQFLCILL